MAERLFGGDAPSSSSSRLGEPTASRIIIRFSMTVLTEIIAATRRRVAECRSSSDLGELERLAQAQVPRGFRKARANSADAILLIVAALSHEELARLAKRATELQLDVLCEVHDEEELGRALDAGCELIGVNSRDLQTFKVDLTTAFRVADFLPYGVVAIAESGIET